MSTEAGRRAAVLVLTAALTACVSAGPATEVPPHRADAATIARGKYLFDAANCVGCHTDRAHGGARLAGGKAVETPFGAYLSRNITPDPAHGIGAWSDADFLRALREGRSPSGAHYFPAFPFTSFTRMTDDDILDLRAYLATEAPAATPNRPHEVPFPFDVRLTMVLWRALYFEEGPMAPDPRHDAEWNNGAYLVEAVGHCAECHSPRNWLGAIDEGRRFAGGRLYGTGASRAPNITSDPVDGIGRWGIDDVTAVLRTGTLPSGETVGAPMSEVVEGTAKLTDADRRAIAIYLKSLPARPGAGS